MSDAGMDEPEQKWPATKTTLSETILLATAVACLGSQASSPVSSWSFWPLTPPAALISSTAMVAPLTICSPNAAYWPVIGPTTPILICASVGVASMAMAAAANVPKVLLIRDSLVDPPTPRGVETTTSLVPLLPAQQAFAPVEPWILPHHQAGVRQSMGKGRDRELDRPVQQKSADRPQLAVGQRIVEKAQQC